MELIIPSSSNWWGEAGGIIIINSNFQIVQSLAPFSFERDRHSTPNGHTLVVTYQIIFFFFFFFVRVLRHRKSGDILVTSSSPPPVLFCPYKARQFLFFVPPLSSFTQRAVSVLLFFGCCFVMPDTRPKRRRRNIVSDSTCKFHSRIITSRWPSSWR